MLSYSPFPGFIIHGELHLLGRSHECSIVVVKLIVGNQRGVVHRTILSIPLDSYSRSPGYDSGWDMIPDMIPNMVSYREALLVLLWKCDILLQGYPQETC